MIETTLDLPLGWLSETEAAWLAEQATGKEVLEIGTYLGRSTVAMARTAAAVVTVDHHAGPPQDSAGATTLRFIENVNRFAVSETVIPIVAGFERVHRYLQPVFEMAFIDGAHDGISVLRDAKAAHGLCRPGASLCFHDYGVHLGVTSGVHELARRWQTEYKVVPETSIAVIIRD